MADKYIQQKAEHLLAVRMTKKALIGFLDKIYEDGFEDGHNERDTERDDKFIDCPLCGEKIKHSVYKNTHLWICKKCPFVGFEYYTDKDAGRARERLNK